MSATEKETPEQIANNTQIQEDDEISLIDLFAVLLRRKWLIIGITSIVAVAVVIYSIISIKLPPEKSPMPNVYTPVAYMLINNASSQGGSLSSMLNSSGLGALASLAGFSASSGSSYSELAIYITTSNPFLDAIVEEFGFIEKWGLEDSKSPIAMSRETLKGKFKTEYMGSSGVFSIGFTDVDPVLACEVVEFATNYIEAKFAEFGLDKNKLEKQNLEENINRSYNEIVRLQKEIQNIERSVSNGYGGVQPIMFDSTMLELEFNSQKSVYQQLKTQYEVLKLQMASETPVFQIIERAQVPDIKSGPSRGKLCIIATFAAGFISVFLAFLLNAIENIKADPEAMSKLKGKKK